MCVHVVYGRVCTYMWLFTQGPLENVARMSEASGPADKVKGFGVPHISAECTFPSKIYILRDSEISSFGSLKFVSFQWMDQSSSYHFNFSTVHRPTFTFLQGYQLTIAEYSTSGRGSRQQCI